MHRTIYVDPPWPEYGGGKIKRVADRHYSLMSLKEIIALPIQKLVHPEGGHLWLWTTNNQLKNALEVIDAWGFEYKSTVTWFKPGRIGLGQWLRGCTEHCFFATTKKSLPYKIVDGKRQQGVTGFTAERREHSVKPEEMRTMIERVSYPPFIELFARREYDHWTCVGNEVKKSLEDILKETENGTIRAA